MSKHMSIFKSKQTPMKCCLAIIKKKKRNVNKLENFNALSQNKIPFDADKLPSPTSFR